MVTNTIFFTIYTWTISELCLKAQFTALNISTEIKYKEKQ